MELSRQAKLQANAVIEVVAGEYLRNRAVNVLFDAMKVIARRSGNTSVVERDYIRSCNSTLRIGQNGW